MVRISAASPTTSPTTPTPPGSRVQTVKSGKVKARDMIGVWLRLSRIVITLSLLIIAAALLIGQGMSKRLIAFLSYSMGEQWQIHLMDVDRALQHALTHDNNRYGFMWSPDGQEIGFAS